MIANKIVNSREAKKAAPFDIFLWGVAKTGYHWIETPRRDPAQPIGYHLTVDIAPKSTVAFDSEIYQPLKSYECLSQFLRLDPENRDELLQFANRFGLLGVEEKIEILMASQQFPL